VLAGVPLQLAKQVMGHAKASMTTDTYGHVLLDEPEWRLAELRRGVARISGLAETRDEAPSQGAYSVPGTPEPDVPE
jgi:hypothetical protein